VDIYIVRHTSVNVEKGLCYGQAEVNLFSTFLQEANDTARLIPDKQSAYTITSASRRCVQLAEVLAKRPVVQDRRLMELHFGDWELKRWDDIEPDILEMWMQDFVNIRCPGGESYTDLYNRSIECFKEISSKNNQNVIIVTHAGVIRCFLSYALEIPFQKTFDIRLAYGGVTKLVFEDNNYSVEFINRV